MSEQSLWSGALLLLTPDSQRLEVGEYWKRVTMGSEEGVMGLALSAVLSCGGVVMDPLGNL